MMLAALTNKMNWLLLLYVSRQQIVRDMRRLVKRKKNDDSMSPWRMCCNLRKRARYECLWGRKKKQRKKLLVKLSFLFPSLNSKAKRMEKIQFRFGFFFSSFMKVKPKLDLVLKDSLSGCRRASGWAGGRCDRFKSNHTWRDDPGQRNNLHNWFFHHKLVGNYMCSALYEQYISIIKFVGTHPSGAPMNLTDALNARREGLQYKKG